MNFMNQDNIVVIALNRIGDVIIANLLFLLCSIPLVTIGPSLTALYHCMLRIVKGNEDKVTKTFFRALRQNFVQSLIAWLALVIVGVILEPIEVKYETGDTVYDILARVCKEKKIQLDANYTPLYSAYYVKGINQLYEFDCGERSGWTYSVNGYFPNYGCSKYEVSDGDVIEWRYTCDLGKDVGDEFEEEQ